MRFAAIEASLGQFPVSLMCRSLRVSRAGFYAWQQRGPSQRQLCDQAMLVDIEASFAANRKRYGSLNLPRFGGHRAYDDSPDVRSRPNTYTDTPNLRPSGSRR